MEMTVIIESEMWSDAWDRSMRQEMGISQSYYKNFKIKISIACFDSNYVAKKHIW